MILPQLSLKKQSFSVRRKFSGIHSPQTVQLPARVRIASGTASKVKPSVRYSPRASRILERHFGRPLVVTAQSVNVPLSIELADFQDKGWHQPDHPEAVKSHRAFKDSLLGIYGSIKSSGLVIEPWSGGGQPYANSAEMTTDVERGHLYYFQTDSGYGQVSLNQSSDHPMLNKLHDGMRLNDVYRIVHDVFHAATGHQFGPKGEWNIALAQSSCFPPEALMAMMTETVMRTSWAFYGPHIRRSDGSIPLSDEADYIPLSQRPQSMQKTLVIPTELIKAFQNEVTIPLLQMTNRIHHRLRAVDEQRLPSLNQRNIN